MGGNGGPLPPTNTTNFTASAIMVGGTNGVPPLYLPTGSGGDCVTTGPFVNMTVNLGPAALAIPGSVNVSAPSGNPFDYNPRCLTRDLVNAVNKRFANASSVWHLLLQPQNVYDFQMQMQGYPGSGAIGVHGGGHYTIGGDPGRDFFVSPGDPVFYLHHAMIDRVWWIWQMLSTSDRVFGSNAIAGTRTFLDMPPSGNATLEDVVQFGYAAGPPREMVELMSTTAGPFCYVYA